MSVKVLLRHFHLYEHKVRHENCQDVFAFREFGPEDSEELKQEVGIECDRDAFEERMQGNTNFQAFVYQVHPTRVLHYIFSTKDNLYCDRGDTTTYFDSRAKYFSNYFKVLTPKLISVDELTAVQQQFTRETMHNLCQTKGLLYNDFNTEGILLQYYQPDQHNFRFLNCTGTYVFREFYGSDFNYNPLDQGVYCNKTKYLELLHGHTNFHVITYSNFVMFNKDIEPNYHTYNIIEYVFATFNDMGCVVPKNAHVNGYHNPQQIYSHHSRGLMDVTTNEGSAITEQFSLWEAKMICNNSGRLPFQTKLQEQVCHDCTFVNTTSLPANTTLLMEYTTAMFNNTQVDTIPYSSVVNTTLLMNTTSTVPVSEMELLTSAASLLLASPVLLAPAMLAIHNLSEIFFDGLANLFTNLGRRK